MAKGTTVTRLDSAGEVASRWIRRLWEAVFHSPAAADNFTWIQRGLGAYIMARYLILFPNSTVLLSDRGVNIPWMVYFPEPHPFVAMALVGTVIFLGGAMQDRGCRAWVLWAALGLHFYLTCLGPGSSSGAYEYIGIFSLFTIAAGATLRERSWAVRLLQVYIVNIYFWAGVHKLTGGVWTEGTILRRVLSSGWGGGEINYEFLPALADAGVGAAVERAVVGGEIIVPLLMILPLRHKLLPIAAAFAFHAGTAVFMNLAEFMCTPMLALGFLTNADKELVSRLWRCVSSGGIQSGAAVAGRPPSQNPALVGRGSVDPRDSGNSRPG